MCTIALRHQSLRHHFDSSARRIGLTLLETLIAIFVVTVGLLGLATLIPVGRWQMEEATRIDRGAATGRAAFRDLSARGHLNMSKWAYASVVAGKPTPVLNSSGGFNSPSGASGNMLVPPDAPVVFDPLMIANNLNNLNVVQSFPYELPGTNQSAIEWSNAPRLARVGILTPNPATSGGNQPPPFIPLSVARAYFTSADDRVFTRPEQREFKPGAMFSDLSVGQGTNRVTSPAVTLSQGDFSWFAVVNPSRFEALTAGSHKVRQFDVVVVVCHKRALDNLTGVTYANRQRVRGERRVHLNFVSSGTFAQGSTDAIMTMSDLPSQAEADEATFLRTGEWIMVTALAPTMPQAIQPPGQTPSPHIEVNFFRVLSVGRQVVRGGQANVWQRRVRLAGSNWTVPNTGTTGGTVAPGFGVIVDGAVAVYRKNLVYDGQGMLAP